ncbi:MAG: OmpA family protein [Acidimicrobiia bacterium]
MRKRDMARRRGRSVSDITRYAGSAAPQPSGYNDDDTVTSGMTFGLIALAIFVAISFFAVRFGTQSIESDLEGKAARALHAAGFTQVEAEASGTAVSLSGSYMSDQEEQQAFDAVAAVSGIGAVEGQIWPISNDELEAAAIRGAPLEASWDFGRITVTGDVSTPEKAALVASTLESSFHTVETEGLTVLEGLDDETAWLGPVLFLVQSSEELLPTGFLRVDGRNGYVVLQGEVLEKSPRDELNSLVAETAASIGFDATPGVRLLDTGPTEEEVEILQEEINEVILDQIVEFEVKSFLLTTNGMSLLDDMAATLASTPEVRVLIEGHTDDRGSDAENQTLSEERALAVFNYFVEKGLDPGRFDIIGQGENQPIESNDTAAGRARNRRIEFTALLDGVNTEDDA